SKGCPPPARAPFFARPAMLETSTHATNQPTNRVFGQGAPANFVEYGQRQKNPPVAIGSHLEVPQPMRASARATIPQSARRTPFWGGPPVPQVHIGREPAATAICRRHPFV